MRIFVSFEGLGLTTDLDRASLADDPEKMRRIAQSIEKANEIWKSWCVRVDGSIIQLAGGRGRCEIPAGRLAELADLRQQYAGAVGTKVAVGVGMRMVYADRALRASKLRGGDRIVVYSPEVDEEIRQQESSANEGEEESQTLVKADPALAQGGRGAGATGAARPSRPSTPHQAPEHSQGEAARAVAESGPARPEMTHAASDMEDSLHQHAENADKKENDEADSEKEGQDQISDVKKQVIAALDQVKAQSQVLEQIRQQAPAVYKSVMGMVQAVITMAKQLKPPEQKEGPIRKAESDEIPEEDPSIQPVRKVKSISDVPLGRPIALSDLPREEWRETIKHISQLQGIRAMYDYSHLLSPAAQEQKYKLLVLDRKSDHTDEDAVHAIVIHPTKFDPNRSKGSPVGGTYGSLDQGGGGKSPALRIGLMMMHRNSRGLGLGRASLIAAQTHALNSAKVKRIRGGLHSTSAEMVHRSVASEYGQRHLASFVGDDNTGSFDDNYGRYSKEIAPKPTKKAEEEKVEVDPIAPEQDSKKLKKDSVSGGAGNEFSPSDFEEEELREGTNHEMEHTDDRSVAQKIAMDHLAENPHYYRELRAAHLEKDDGAIARQRMVVGSTSEPGPDRDTSKRGNIGKIKTDGSPGTPGGVEGHKAKYRQVNAGMVSGNGSETVNVQSSLTAATPQKQ